MALSECLINEIDIRYSTDCVLSNDCFNTLHLNTRSCRKKMDGLVQLINDFQGIVHVVVFTETWLYEGEICYMLGYDAYHSCREDRGRGVSIFVLTELRSQLVMSNCIHECNFVMVKLIDYNLKILGVYNPGRNISSFLDEFEQSISNHKRIYICGDFNIYVLDTENSVVEDYVDRVQSAGYIILNSLDQRFATRKSNTIATTIDHVFTNLFEYRMELVVKDTECHLSDHKTIILSLYMPLVNTVPTFSKTVIRYDHITSSSLINQIQPCENFNELTSELKNVIDNSKYTINYRRKEVIRKPHINSQLLAAINYKNKLFQKYKRAPEGSTLK